MKRGIKNSNSLQENILLLHAYQNLNVEKQNLAEENTQLKAKLDYANKVINVFKEREALNKLRKFGKKSEAHLEENYGLQQQLPIFDATEEEAGKVPAEAKPEQETITYTRKKQKSNGRRIDTSKLPREKQNHDLTDAEKHCDKCGKLMEQFGEDISEQLDYIPAQVKVIEHVCPKYSCRCCNTAKSAKKHEAPIAKSMATASLLSEIIISKYEHHLPLYRQSKIFMQQGIDIPANTLGNWIMQSGEALSPLGLALKTEINNTHNLQADESPVTMLSQKSKGYMWCYNSLEPENRFVLFEYSNNRSSDTVNKTLANYSGIMQTDGYDGYNYLRAKKEIIAIGCFAHCRRKFAEIIKIGITGKADEALAFIKKLYEIEAKAREEKLDFNARKELRQKYSKPILDEMLVWLQKTEPLAPPQSALGKAITYALNQWKYLCRYIEHGEAEIDNNFAENQIRPFALGRKNWMFIGNENAANTAALLYSLIQTCKLHNINARVYLTYVLNQAGKMLRKEIDPRSLLPQFIDKTLLL